MAEIIDEHIVLDERVPASMSTSQKNDPGFFDGVTEAVSKIPEAAFRFVDVWNRTEADSGDPLARAIRAGFSEDYYQELKQQRANASRMAELQLQDAETQAQTNALNLQQARILAPLQVQQAKANLANAERQGRNADQLFEQRSKLHPLQMQEAKANAGFSLLRLHQAQQNAWDNDAVKKRKIINDRMKQDLGYFLMNDAGRAVFDNSMARRAFEEASLIMSVIKNNPEQAKYYAENTGWTYSLNGDNVDTLTSPDGKKVFTANEEGMHKLMGDIQKTLMDDITAARIKGTDAQSIPEASAKVMLNNQNFLQVYGTPGNAYHALRSFMDQKVMLKDGSMKDLFTPSQKMVHATSVTLDAAIEDNAFSQAEMAALSAQFVPTVKQFGGEVIWGQGVDDTQIIMRNNGMTRTYPIREFANLLRQRDVITPAFNQHVAEVARKMNLNQLQQNADGKPMTSQEQNIVDFYGPPPEGVTIETHGTLGDTFSAGYRDLDDTQRAALAAIYTDWLPRYFKKRDKNGKIIPVDLKEMSEKDRLALLRQANTAWKDNIINAELPDRIFSPVAAILYQEEMKALNPEIESLKKEILAEYPRWGKTFFEEYGKGNFDIDKFAEKYAGPRAYVVATPPRFSDGTEVIGANFGSKVHYDDERTNFDKNLRPKINKYIKLVNQYEDRSKWLREITDIQQNGLKED